VTVLSHDQENDPDIVALVAASAALTLSGVPFMGPIGAARVGIIDGTLTLNPTLEQMKTTDLDLVVAGTQDALMMVESEAQELPEDRMIEALMFAHREMQPVIEAIIELAEHAAKEPFDFQPEDHSEVVNKIKVLVGGDIRAAYEIQGKHDRHVAVGAAKSKAASTLVQSEANPTASGRHRSAAPSRSARPTCSPRHHRAWPPVDGRALDTVRAIVSEVSVLPRTHGSALFTRGETQALVVATLGTGEDEQYVDSLSGTYKEHFLLHYNFPPTRSARPGGWAAPSVGRPATASWRGGRCGR
jgi:polyribonucleotide nucleotidyltransferase